jgi:hypothetical protein
MERIGNEVERSLARTGRGEGLALAEITAVWPQAVGEGIARNAWPSRFGRDGTLHVATASATWAFELDRMSPEIADRLASLLADRAPTQLRFRPGPVPEPGPSGATDRPMSVREPAPEAVAAADSAAASIEDPELRELVARAARASFSSGSSDRGFW